MEAKHDAGGVLTPPTSNPSALPKPSSSSSRSSSSSTNANMSTRDRRACDGRTPLHVAAANGHLDVVKLLVSYGADLNARS